MSNIEHRSFKPTEQTQFRASEDTETGKKYLEGYAAVFNNRSKLIADWGANYYEILERSAFDEVLKDEALDTVFAVQHNRGDILGRTTSGTLVMSTDDVGLRFKVELPDTQLAHDTYELVKRGDLAENSFAFGLSEGEGYEWSETEEGDALRTISSVSRLVDVSLVTDAAYSNTTIEARGHKEFLESRKEPEIDKELDAKKLNDEYHTKARLLKLKLKLKNTK
jgi:HK97 family phage prohead protease